VRYFAYGSNMSRSRIEARLGRVVDLGRARCPARTHRFSKLGRDGTGKGNIEPAAGGVVWGVVYEIDALQLDRLVEVEFGYRVIGVELDLEVLAPAVTFEALQPKAGLAPTREYIDHYIAGIREHRIPEDYLAAVLGDWLA
jgi:gamma-glutamylcyclotransferase